MSFLKPKVPKAPPAPNPAITATDTEEPVDTMAPSAMSLISTSARGLRRRASTQRNSLIGGA